MAELDVGQHCQVQHCRQRDFLPFVCDGCSGIFCLEHRSKDSHGCPEVNVVKERPKTDEHKSYSCSFKDCTEVELVAVICPYCEKNFCLRHRHQPDHGCEKLEIPKPRMAATQKLVKDIIDTKAAGAVSKGRKGAKTSGTAAKVALMKLKMHADGDKSLPQVEFILNSGVAGGYEGSLQSRSESLELDIEKRAPSAPVPEHKKTERIYFQVYLPKGSKEKSKAMFFCLRWSIGKVVDFAASLASLRNENNKLTAKKLRLCHVPSGEALPLDHTLETWITKESSPLYNGGNVILEYLNDEEQILKNVDSYLE